jgi:TonB family protein
MTGIFSPFFLALHSSHGFAGKSLALLFDAALKGTSVLMLCGVSVLIRRRASAAARHLVWSLGLGATLALPLFSLMLPAWSVPVISRFPAGAAGERTVDKEHRTVVVLKSRVNTVPNVSPSPAPADGGVYPYAALWILSIWAAGSWLLAVRLAVGENRVRRIAKSSRPYETRQAKGTLEKLCSFFRLSRAVQLRTSAEIAVSFTRGSLHPVILLPAEAPHWSREQLEWVLAHELAHVRRNDWLTQMTAQLACAVFWFHPLVWLAASAMRKERERACDDMVLSLGHPAADYAEFLLALSRSLRPRNDAWSTSVALAQSSQLEVRMKALLDPQLNHKPVARSRAFLITALAALLLLPVAAMRVAAKDSSGNISGTIRDPSGAVIPDASITLIGRDQKVKIKGSSGADGAFKFAALPPGGYRLEIASPGFALTRSADLDLAPSADLHQDITMNLGEMLEEVVVHGHKPGENTPASRPVPQRIRVGGMVQAAKLVFQPRPAYPEALQKQGIQGTVFLHAVIGTSGQILSLAPVTDADPALTKAAMDAVRQWKYTPTLLNGEPVEVVTTITVGFRLDE